MKKEWVVLCLIILFGLLLRVWQLDKAPIELFGDEIDVGLQASSILKTGRDYLGNSFPVMFHSFQEYRLPLFIYSDVPFIALFGLNEWGVRLAGVFWGMVAIAGIYLLGKDLFGPKTGIISALLLSITPWHLQYSRQAGIEAGMLLAFITLALWSFYRGLKNFKWLILSGVLFALSVYVYATSLLFTILLTFFLGFFFKKEILSYGVKKLSLLAVICLTILIPFINLYLQQKAGQRFSTISIFNDSDINDDIIGRRTKESDFFAVIFHNRYFTYGQEISKNYLRSFSTDFLFVNGDPNLRQSVGGVGEFYFFEFILMIIGIFMLTKKRIHISLTLFFFLLITPFSSSLTKDGSHHASRLMLMLLPLTFFAGIGLNFLTENINNTKRLLLFFLAFLSVLNIGFYFHRYYIEWPQDSYRFWQYGYKEALNFIKDNDGNYSRIYFNNTYETTFPRFLFWYNFDPAVLQKNYENQNMKKDIVPGFDGFKFMDKYYFGTINNLIEDKGFAQILGPTDLYLANQRDEIGAVDWVNSAPKRVKILKTVYDPFKKPIFFIIAKKADEKTN